MPDRAWTDYLYGATNQHYLVAATLPPQVGIGVDGFEHFAGLATVTRYNGAMNVQRSRSYMHAAVERDTAVGHVIGCEVNPQALVVDRACRYQNSGSWLSEDITNTGCVAEGIPMATRSEHYYYNDDGLLTWRTSAEGESTRYVRNVMGSVTQTRIGDAVTEYVLDQYPAPPIGSPTFASGIGDGRPTFVLEYRTNDPIHGRSPAEPVIRRNLYDHWGRGMAECHVGSANPFPK